MHGSHQSSILPKGSTNKSGKTDMKMWYLLHNGGSDTMPEFGNTFSPHHLAIWVKGDASIGHGNQVVK